MRRWLAAQIISLLFVGLLMSAPAQAAADEISVVLDGRQIAFDAPPRIVDGRTLVPMRIIFEALGAKVAWDGAAQTVLATRGATTVALTIGSTRAVVDGQPHMLDVPAEIFAGRAFIPLRFIGEALGATISWDGATRTIHIIPPAPPLTLVPEQQPQSALVTEPDLDAVPEPEPVPVPLPDPPSVPKPEPTLATTQYAAPSTFYRMGNPLEVAVRPDGKELYIFAVDTHLILVVDIESPDYPVLGAIPLAGSRVAPIPYIAFSPDGQYAYLSRALQGDYVEDPTQFSDFTKILVIDTAKRQVKAEIPMPSPIAPTASVVPSPDNKWLYFTAGYPPAQPLGIGKLNLETQEVVNFLPLDGANFIVLSDDGNQLYATQGWNLFGPSRNLLTVIDTAALSVISSVEVGDGPRYAALMPDGRKAYVSNQWSNDVSAVDLETMKVTATIDVGIEPRVIAITPDGRKAYVTLPRAEAGTTKFGFGNTVAVIDTEEDAVLKRIPVHIEPLSVAIAPDGTRAFVSDGNSNGSSPAEVHVIDTVKDIYARPIILRAAARYAPTAIDISPDGRRLFVVSEARKDGPNDTSLLVIDSLTGSRIEELDIQPRGVTVSHDGTKLYVFSPQRLYVINSNSLEVVQSVDLTEVYPGHDVGDQEAFRVVVNRAEDTAYLLGDTADVMVVNLAAGEVVSSIRFADGPVYHQRGLALTPSEDKLLASDYNSRTVAVIDTRSNTVVARVPVANLPGEIRVSQDGKRAYVLQEHSTTLMTIIDVDTQTVLKSVDFPAKISAARDFELSPDERFAYIACFDDNFVMVYDLMELKVARVIDTGLDPYGMARISGERLIYVTNFSTDDITVVDTATNSVIKTIQLER